MTKRTLVYGPPGAGKTTFARKLREEEGREWLEQEHYRTSKAFKRAVLRLSDSDLDLVVVRCCFTEDELNEWKALTQATEVVRLDPGPKECKSRLYKRGHKQWKGEIMGVERWYRNWETGVRRLEPKRRRAYPTNASNGYGRKHQNERKRWEPIVAAGNVRCARCRKLILPGMAWHLDHAPGKRGYLGPSHAKCNVVAGAKLGAAITNAKKRARRRVSRRW